MKAYPAYKNGGLPWLASIPEHWLLHRLGAICHKKEIKALHIDDILICSNSGSVFPRNEKTLGLVSDKEDAYQGVEEGDLLIHGMDTWHGAIAVSKYSGKCTKVVHVCDSTQNKAFLAYFLQMLAFGNVYKAISNGVRGNTSDFRSWNKARVIAVAYPPTLEEQEIIVAYLDKKCAEIEELISRRQSIIERLRELKRSIIAEAVTKGLNPDVPMKESGIDWMREVPVHWTISKIKNKAKVSPRVDISHINFGDLITFTPMEYVKQGYFIPNNMPYEAKYNSYTPYAEGDIVIAKVTPCFENGNICIMNNLSSHVGFGSSELIVIRSNDILPAFLMYALRNPHFIAEGKKTMYGTGGLKRISPRFIPNCNIAVPPEKEQQFIVAYLNKKCAEIDELISRHERTIEKLKELKTSTIAHVVTGKVDVRDTI